MSESVTSFPGEFPYEVLSLIAGFADQQTQRTLMNVNHGLRKITLDSLRVGGKVALGKFEEFIVQKMDKVYQRYQQEVIGLRNAGALPIKLNPNRLIVDYLTSQLELKTTMEQVFKNEEEITSLEGLRERSYHLFHVLRPGKVAFYIAKYFPHSAGGMQAHRDSWFLSPFGMFHEVLARYKTFNALLEKQDEALNHTPVNVEALKKIINDMYQECRLLILDGYVNAGFEVLPFLDQDVKKEELLFSIIFSWKKDGLLSSKNIEKVIKFSKCIESEQFRSNFYIDLLKLPLSKELVRKIYEKSEHIYEEEYRKDILLALCARDLSFEERSWIFNSLRQMQYLGYIRDVCVALCQFPLLNEEKEEMFKIAKSLTWPGDPVKIFIALCRFPLSLEEKDKIFRSMLHKDKLKIWNQEIQNKFLDILDSFQLVKDKKKRMFKTVNKQINQMVEGSRPVIVDSKDRSRLLQALCRLPLSAEEKSQVFALMKEMSPGMVGHILSIFCRYQELSQKEKTQIFDRISTISGPTKEFFELRYALRLASRSLKEIFKSAQSLRSGDKVRILQELLGYELSLEEREEIVNERNETFKAVQLIPDEQKMIIFKNLCQLKHSREDRRKLFEIVQSFKEDHLQIKALTKLCNFNLEREERDEIVIFASKSRCEEFIEEAFVLLCKFPLGLEERREMLKIAKSFEDEGLKGSIFELLCKFKLEPEERREIFDITYAMQYKAAQVNVLIALYGPELLLSERQEIIALAERTEACDLRRHIFAELSIKM